VAVAAAGSVLWTHSSEPLSELLADFWYPSDNLIGEALLRALGVARSGPPGTDAAGLALVGEELAALGIPAGGIDLADGSGLSRYDLATPRALAGVLQADWNAPYRDLVLDALPVAGVRGTLAHVFSGTPLERRVFAKSGSMSHVSALAGYLATQRHGAVTFAFLVDDRLGATAPLEELRMRILSRLATD
jgi:D-alanyl-D-alanine carboxypeptidase/D-alanyl-D-alanine-endopeptidase (penicillin-binding protein 4)